MKNAIQNFDYKGKLIEFDFSKPSIMVNATEMAKVYGKRVDVFLKTDSTKSFIDVLKFPPISVNLTPLKDSEIMITKGRTGTWMHRLLALKFAAWLDPEFEVWVYFTIDKIMFGTMREDAIVKSKIEIEKEKLIDELLNDPKYVRLVELEGEGKKMAGKISKQQKHQLLLFTENN